MCHTVAAFNPAAITRGRDGASLAVYSVSGLTLTADGLEAFTRGLGLQSFGAAALTGQNLGSLSLDLHYGHSVAAVPEPSAWAMMGIGLVAWIYLHHRWPDIGRTPVHL